MQRCQERLEYSSEITQQQNVNTTPCCKTVYYLSPPGDQFVLGLGDLGSQMLQIVKSFLPLEEKHGSGIRKVSSSQAENLVLGFSHIWYCFDKCLMFLLSIFDYFYNLEPCLIMQQMNYKWNQCADVSEAIWTSEIIKRLNIDKTQ